MVAHVPEDEAEPTTRVTTTELLDPAPNPFNPRVEIAFSLERGQEVELAIFDLRGRKVVTLLSDRLSQGPHSVVWGGKDGRGREVASGVYFARFQAEDLRATKRLALVR